MSTVQKSKVGGEEEFNFRANCSLLEVRRLNGKTFDVKVAGFSVLLPL